MDNYSVEAILSVSDRGFTVTMKQAAKVAEAMEGNLKSGSKSMVGFASSFAVAEKAISVVGRTIASSIDKAVSRVDTMNRFPKIMEQIGFSSEKSKASVDKLSKGIEGLPTALNDITASTQKIALLTGDLEKATDTSLALNDAFYASGASAEDASRGLIQYTQMLSKGTVDMQSWRTLQETMGVALNDLAGAFGYAGESAQNDLYDALKSGTITFNQLNDKLIELDGGVNGFAARAKTASGGIATSFQNLGTAVVKGLANVINTADTSLQENGLPGFRQQIENVKNATNAAFTVIEGRVSSFVSTVAPAVKLVADNMDVLTTTLTPAAAGFALFKTADVAASALKNFNEKKAEAGKTLKELHEALRLSAQATTLEAKATDLSAQASVANEEAKRKAALAASLDAKAIEAENESIKAEAAAKQLEKEATKAQAEAEKAVTAAKKSGEEADRKATTATKAKESADKKAAIAVKAKESADEKAAAAAKMRASVDEKAATASKLTVQADKLIASAVKAKESADRKATTATKAKESADKKAAIATEKRANADKKAATASKLTVQADKLGVSATKAKESADEKVAIATKMRANADKAAAIAEKADTAALGANAAAQAANTAAEGANAAAVTVSNSAVTAKTLLLGILSGELGIVTAAQTAWNAAMAANPIGMIITAVAVLTTALIGISKILIKLGDSENTVSGKTKALSKDTDEFIESLKESDKAYEENISKVNASATATVGLADKVIELSKAENKSAAEKQELQGYIKQLNNSMEGLNLQYDEENDKLSIGEKALRKKAEAYKEQKKAEIYIERYNELLEKQAENDEKIAKAQELYNSTQKKLNKELEYSDQAMGAYNVELANQKEEIARLQKTKDEYAQKEAEITGLISENQAEQTRAVIESVRIQEAALAESIANQTVTLDQLSEANQETVKNLQEAWSGYADHATNMFDVLSDKQTLSVDKMIANLQENQRIISEYGSNMEGLRDRFSNLHLSEDVLDDLAEMGPEGAGYVAALVNASDEQLQTLAHTMENGGSVATESFMKSWNFDNSNLPEAIQKMVTQAESSMRQTVMNTDWSSLGENMASGTAGGLESGGAQVQTAAVNVLTDTRFMAGAVTGEGSPCASYIELGNNMVAGLALGLSDGAAATNAAVTMSEQVMQAVKTQLDKADFSGVGEKAFSGMASAASKSMNKVSSAVSKGIQSASSAVNTGMTRMNTAVSGNFQSITLVTENGVQKMESCMRAGMSNLQNAVRSGMSGAKNAAVSGVNSITSAFSGLNDRLYKTGIYAMQGFVNGMESKRSAVMATARSIARSAAEEMEKELEVGSPSKVTTKIGEWTGIGPAIGMEKMIPKVNRAAEKLAQAMIPAPVADFAGVTQKYCYAGTVDMRVSNQDTEDTDILGVLKEIREELKGGNRTYVLEVPLELEGREVARATAVYTQEELEKLEKINNRKKGYR